MSPRLALLVALGSLPACASWSRVEKPILEAADGSFRFEAPLGWMRLSEEGAVVVLTREGPPIQWFEAIALPVERAFPLLGEPVPPLVTAEELAQLTITELASEIDPIPLSIHENLSVAMGLHPGFLVRGEYEDAQGLRFGMLAAGFVLEDHLYTLLFRAPSLYIFERDRIVFDRAIETFRVRGEEGLLARPGRPTARRRLRPGPPAAPPSCIWPRARD